MAMIGATELVGWDIMVPIVGWNITVPAAVRPNFEVVLGLLIGEQASITIKRALLPRPTPLAAPRASAPRRTPRSDR